VKLGPVLGRTTGSADIFQDEGERRAVLLRMGTGPTAWAYLDTLARAARLARKALGPKLVALEQEGLVASEEAPAGLRYRLTDDGRRVRAGSDRAGSRNA
jgi:hypothetical protein